MIKNDTHFKSGECIRGDVEGGHLYVSEEVVELFRAQGDLGQRLVSYAFPQHDPTVQSDIWRLVTTGEQRQDISTMEI